jgi:SAM-dependent methyltransferase
MTHDAVPSIDRQGRADGELNRFFAVLERGVVDGGFVKLVLAKYQGIEPGLMRLLVRKVTLRAQASLSLVYRYQTKDITKNFAVPAGLEAIRQLLGPAFKNAHLLTQTSTVDLAISKRGLCTLRTRAAHSSAAPAPVHNREKQRGVDLNRPFLVALGVTDDQHRLIPAMARKWRQINKFIEVFAHAYAASPLVQAERVRVVDFGSGKGYLTFAIHDHLRGARGVEARVTGVELRQDLVQLCTDATRRLGIDGLVFERGDVTSYAPGGVDVMIALHACDTATDRAIHLGLRAGAAIIMCSPCCHKQIRPQLLCPHPLRPILQHGVHLGQEAEMLTDGLRALWLEACGYDTQVFEFISLEHTHKNKMILAVKRAQPKPADAVLAQVAQIKDFYGIREHCLEGLLKADGMLP